MEFEYKGTKYDTYSDEHRLQLVTDKGFKQKLINEYFDKSDDVLKESKLDLAYQLALMSAKYEDVISNLTDEFSIAGTYPKWVVESAEKRAEMIYGDDD